MPHRQAMMTTKILNRIRVISRTNIFSNDNGNIITGDGSSVSVGVGARSERVE